MTNATAPLSPTRIEFAADMMLQVMSLHLCAYRNQPARIATVQDVDPALRLALMRAVETAIKAAQVTENQNFAMWAMQRNQAA